MEASGKENNEGTMEKIFTTSILVDEGRKRLQGLGAVYTPLQVLRHMSEGNGKQRCEDEPTPDINSTYLDTAIERTFYTHSERIPTHYQGNFIKHGLDRMAGGKELARTT